MQKQETEKRKDINIQRGCIMAEAGKDRQRDMKEEEEREKRNIYRERVPSAFNSKRERE